MKEKIILLIEDNQDDIALTLRALGKWNMKNKVITIADGEEALEYLFCKGKYMGRNELEIPTLVLLDLNLPKVNGFEILKAIRENELTKLLPVVILTSSKEEQDIISGYKLGVNSYMQKPIDFERFFEAIKTLGVYWLEINETPDTLK
jgi:two-component system response regulator